MGSRSREYREDMSEREYKYALQFVRAVIRYVLATVYEYTRAQAPGIPTLYIHRRYQHRSSQMRTTPMDFTQSLSVADYERTQNAAKANLNHWIGKAVLPGCISYYMGDSSMPAHGRR